jgi:hypothetical protein
MRRDYRSIIGPESPTRLHPPPPSIFRWFLEQNLLRQTHTLMSDKTRYDGNFYTMLFEPVPPWHTCSAFVFKCFHRQKTNEQFGAYDKLGRCLIRKRHCLPFASTQSFRVFMRSVMLTYHVSFICCVCVRVIFLLCLFDSLFFPLVFVLFCVLCCPCLWIVHSRLHLVFFYSVYDKDSKVHMMLYLIQQIRTNTLNVLTRTRISCNK